MKRYLPMLFVMLISFSFFGSIIYFSSGPSIKENRLKKIVTSRALEGNPYAFKIKDRSIYVNWSEKEVILKALEGNENALKILGIKMEEK